MLHLLQYFLLGLYFFNRVYKNTKLHKDTQAQRLEIYKISMKNYEFAF